MQKYPDPLATAFRIRAGELLGVDPDWILCGNGSDDILTIVTRAFVGTSDMVRFANPSYLLYRTLAEIQGAACDIINYNADWSLPAEFAKPNDWIRLAFLANPNSPSGTMVPPAAVAELADALPCPLLVDEAYVDFADTNCLSLVAENDKIMVARTLSKSYALAGLRFGYLVAQPHVIRELRKVKDSYNCDALSIAGATAAIDDQEWLAETARQNPRHARANDGRAARARLRRRRFAGQLRLVPAPERAGRAALPAAEASRRAGALHELPRLGRRPADHRRHRRAGRRLPDATKDPALSLLVPTSQIHRGGLRVGTHYRDAPASHAPAQMPQERPSIPFPRRAWERDSPRMHCIPRMPSNCALCANIPNQAAACGVLPPRQPIQSSRAVKPSCAQHPHTRHNRNRPNRA